MPSAKFYGQHIPWLLAAAPRAGHPKDVQEYIRENPTLASGHTVRAKFRLTEGSRCTISDAIDHFGKGNMRVQCENPDASWREPKSYIVSLRVNDVALRDYALRNTPDIEVIKPESLRDEVHEAYGKALGSLQPLCHANAEA